MQLKKNPADNSQSPESLQTEPEKKVNSSQRWQQIIPRIPLVSAPPGYFRNPMVNQGPLRLENPADKFSLQFEHHDSILQEYLTGFWGFLLVCLFVLIKKYRQGSD